MPLLLLTHKKIIIDFILIIMNANILIDLCKSNLFISNKQDLNKQKAKIMYFSNGMCGSHIKRLLYFLSNNKKQKKHIKN